jgi:hypothetical protein
METNAKTTVLAFLKALNEENFDSARKLVNDNMKFKGVLGSRDDADSYFNDMKKMKLKYEVLKVFSDAQEVCVFYNINMSGKEILTCGWYQLLHDKISNIVVIFDPRPVLENAGKK